MLSSIYFLLTFSLCFILLFAIKKLDRKVSLTNHLVLCYVLQLCMGAVCALPLSILGIPIRLNTMSAIYTVLALLMLLYYRKRKEKQAYYLDRWDAANLFILAAFMAFVFIRVFSLDIKLSFFSTDIANHFDYAMNIVRTGELNTMYFASLNNSVFIQLLEPLFPGVQAYKSMIIAETVSNFLTGIMFYVLISYRKRSFRFRLVSPVLTILFFAGWPLYQFLLGGFVYWGIGVTLFLFGLYLLYLYQDNAAVRTKLLWLLMLDIYCIAICYMLFIPFVLGVFMVCLIALSLATTKDRAALKRFLIIAFTIGILGSLILAGALYLYFGDFSIFLSYLARDGGIHKEVYRDYIYFVPFIAYIGGKIRKNKTLSLNYISLLTFFAFTVISCILCLNGIVSPYYYYKLYFILWALVWLVTCDAVDLLLQDNYSWIYTYTAVLLFLCVFTFTPLRDKFIEKGFIPNYIAEFPLYSAVGSYLKAPRETRYDDEHYWELMYYLDENSLNLPLVTDSDYYYWYNTFFNSKHYTSERFDENLSSLPDTFAIDRESEAYHKYQDRFLADYEVLFSNSFADVLRAR